MILRYLVSWYRFSSLLFSSRTEFENTFIMWMVREEVWRKYGLALMPTCSPSRLGHILWPLLVIEILAGPYAGSGM